MTMEQRIWIASLLSAVMLFAFAQTMPKSRPAAPAEIQETLAKLPEPTAGIMPQLLENEEVVELKSDSLLVKIGKESAAIRSVTLNKFEDILSREPLVFGSKAPILALLSKTKPINWKLTGATKTMASWTSVSAEAAGLNLSIELNEKGSSFSIRLLSTKPLSDNPISPELVASWHRSDKMSGRYNMLEGTFLTNKAKPWQREYLKYMSSKQPKDVPRGTFLSTLSERFFCSAIKLDKNLPMVAKLLPSSASGNDDIAVLLRPEAEAPLPDMTFLVYVGPRDFFYLEEAGFQKAFPLGILAKIGLMLVAFLKLLASWVHNYGLAIIIMAILITSALAPLSLVGFRSMKKLQELQPKLEQIKKKFDNDPQKVNRAMLELFREHKVSPLGGCLPMLLQLPIFFALWSAVSHVIELRGANFLWIQDLSLPDKLAKLPMGLDLNILPILVAITMYVQTKMTQSKTPSAQAQSMKFMQGPLMPVLFGAMFYGVPSGLVLYWFVNSLFSLIIFRIAKV